MCYKYYYTFFKLSRIVNKGSINGSIIVVVVIIIIIIIIIIHYQFIEKYLTRIQNNNNNELIIRDGWREREREFAM